MNKFTACSAVILFSMCTVAGHAAGLGGFYIGGAGGYSTVAADGVDFNEKTIGYKGFLGYAISDVMAIEGEYIVGGSPAVEIGAGTVNIAPKAYNAAFLFRARTASAFSVFAKVGYAKYDWAVEDTGSGTTVANVDDSGMGLSYGGGLAYLFWQKYLLRAEYQGIRVSDGKWSELFLGIGYRF